MRWKQGGEESSAIDEEAIDDLDIVGASGESDEDGIRNVIGQATKAMREQSELSDDDNSYDEAGDSEEDWQSRKGSDFQTVRSLRVGLCPSRMAERRKRNGRRRDDH